MAQLNDEEMEGGEENSRESSSEAEIPADNYTTSSSSLRFSNGQTFEEITSEVIREMHKIEERNERGSREAQEAGEPLQIPAEAANRGNQENPIREIYDLTETDNEEAAASNDWKSRMEETVDMLVIENAEQNAMLKAQREQMTKMVDIVDRIISCVDGGPQSSHRSSPAILAAGQNEPFQNVLDTNIARTSRKRRPTTIPYQPTSVDPTASAAKRTRPSSSPGGQKKN